MGEGRPSQQELGAEPLVSRACRAWEGGPCPVAPPLTAPPREGTSGAPPIRAGRDPSSEDTAAAGEGDAVSEEQPCPQVQVTTGAPQSARPSAPRTFRQAGGSRGCPGSCQLCSVCVPARPHSGDSDHPSGLSSAQIWFPVVAAPGLFLQCSPATVHLEGRGQAVLQTTLVQGQGHHLLTLGPAHFPSRA